jgi:hypothetical protein
VIVRDVVGAIVVSSAVDATKIEMNLEFPFREGVSVLGGINQLW